MRRFSLVILITAAVLAAAASCAQRESEDTTKLEEMAFDAWMLKYVNKGVENSVAVKQPDGSYIKFITDGKQDMDASADTIVWLRLDYTGTDLFDNVFVTRNEDMALQQATYTTKTHYISDYIFCGDENHSMIKGQFDALKDKKLVKPDGTTIKMSEGTEVILYMPSYLAFGTSGFTDDQGYGGQYKLGGTKPVIERLKVVEIVKDPVEWEEKRVVSYALDRYGMPETDTTATCFYIDTVRFNQELELKYGEPMSLPFEKEYALSADSTAKIWFIGKFLDGFIFDTNIDTTYYRFYNRRFADGYKADDPESDQFKVMSYNPDDNKDEYISAFFKAIPELRRGQWSRILFTSNYGYGATGLSAALKSQQDYYNYYMSYLYSSYYSGYGYGGYGSGYGGYGSGYYDSYYNSSYYNNPYYNYSTSSSSSDEPEIMTEVQPYTPLIFEIYIEVDEDE